LSTRRQWRTYDRLAENGRRLASEREDLIAAGVDSAKLAVPLHPVPPHDPRPSGRIFDGPPPGPSQVEHLREISRAWAIVSLACVAALAGCIAAVGAMLVINDALTWHALVGTGAALMWTGGAVLAGSHASGLRRRARALASPRLRAVPNPTKGP
jgi:hypothetical protein